MKRAIHAALAACLLLVTGAACAADSVQVKDAWIREAPANAKAWGAFATIENHSAKARTVVGASSSAAEIVQLHQSITENGMAKMVPVEFIDIPANGAAKLQPGGLHIMLINPKQAVKAGDKVEITLKFKDGAAMPVSFEVRKAEGMPMDHGSMGNMDHGNMHH